MAVRLSEILGQDMAVSILRNSIRLKGSLAQAYIFVGPRGVGKRSVSIAYAKALNCTGRDSNSKSFDACDTCLSCRKIEEGFHPDVETVSPLNSSISISQIRELKKKALYRPLEGIWKVYIIDDIGLATKEAANSLLKIVEESPPYVQIILITENSYSILPTIRSRCQVIRFSPLPSRIVKRILVEKFHRGGDEAENLARISEGSISKALAYLEGDDADRRIAGMFMGMIENQNMEDFFKWIQDASLDRESARNLLGVLLNMARRDFSKSPNSEKANIARKLLYTLDLLNRNVNVRLALENLFLG